MRKNIKIAYKEELNLAKEAYQSKNFDESFIHLERCHILGQSYSIPHTVSHWWMLKIGIKTGNPKEIIGQISRIIAALFFSKIWVPLGNTGGSDVNPLKPMTIPDDLKRILESVD